MLAFDPAGYSLKWYADFFTNLNWQGAVQNSLVIAFFATLLSTTLGHPRCARPVAADHARGKRSS